MKYDSRGVSTILSFIVYLHVHGQSQTSHVLPSKHSRVLEVRLSDNLIAECWTKIISLQRINAQTPQMTIISPINGFIIITIFIIIIIMIIITIIIYILAQIHVLVTSTNSKYFWELVSSLRTYVCYWFNSKL